jgi:hypothetical protein
MKKPRVILHPFFFAIFPAISLVADHVRFISMNNTIVGMAIFTLLVTFIFLRVLKAMKIESQKAGIIVSCFLLLFFSYGHVFYLISTTLPELDLRHRHLLPIWGLLSLLLVYFSIRVKKNFSSYTIFLNAMGGLLVVLSVVQIASYEISTQNIWQPVREFETAGTDQSSSNTHPDIYYIILDAYANASTLREVYNFDNDEFITYLQDREFFVAEESFSNYPMTRLSLSSSLNMDYLDKLSDELSPNFGESDRGFELPMQMIENNNVMRFLKSKGYSFIFLGSGNGITQGNRYADHDVQCGFVDETVGRIIQSTLLWPLADRYQITENDERNRRLCMFEKIAEMPDMEGPKFIFAHLPVPHLPFLFDANGNPIQVYKAEGEHTREHYVNQLIFVNKKVEEMVDAILLKSEIEPIIIIQGDTGPSYGYESEAAIHTPTNEIYQQNMRILNAYHLPNTGADLLYKGISPVNTFRLIFNLYFGANFPLLDDQSYFSTDDQPYRFTNVTEIVDYH